MLRCSHPLRPTRTRQAKIVVEIAKARRPIIMMGLRPTMSLRRPQKGLVTIQSSDESE